MKKSFKNLKKYLHFEKKDVIIAECFEESKNNKDMQLWRNGRRARFRF